MPYESTEKSQLMEEGYRQPHVQVTFKDTIWGEDVSNRKDSVLYLRTAESDCELQCSLSV